MVKGGMGAGCSAGAAADDNIVSVGWQAATNKGTDNALSTGFNLLINIVFIKNKSV
jgi:hypothetical protein